MIARRGPQRAPEVSETIGPGHDAAGANEVRHLRLDARIDGDECEQDRSEHGGREHALAESD